MFKAPSVASLTFTASILFLTFLLSLSYRSSERHVVYSASVGQSNRVIVNIDNVGLLVKDAETGQRGYLLTGAREFLEPYTYATSRIHPALESLTKATSDNPVQQRTLRKLKPLVARRLTRLAMIANNHDIQEMSLADRRSAMIQGKQLMDSVRLLLGRMRAEEESLLEGRVSQEETARWTAIKYMVATTVCAMLLLGFFFVSVQRELKTRLAIERELESKVAALNRSNSELEQFAYVASHDLQEPVRKMQTFSNRLLLKYKSVLPPDGEHMLERIDNSAQRMRTLIEDLLTFSRLVNRESKLETTDIAQVVEAVLDDLSELVLAKDATVRVGVLPRCNVCASQMRQLFQNLIANALKFSRPGTRPFINITHQLVMGSVLFETRPAERENIFHRICVEDNGIGFDEQYLEKIFVIFQRLHSLDAYGGTGIGLAVCKRIVTNHRGYITARSREGQGTTFIIHLPADL